MSYFFSIIIPTFNSAEYIRLALDSCAIQTYKNFEVVVIDGISDDNTLKVVGEFQNRLNLKILSEKDNGIYDAMNKGVQMSRGEILYFLGSDDQLHGETILQEIFNVFNYGKHFDVVYGNVNRFRLGNTEIKEKLAFTVSNHRVINKLKLFRYLGICHQGIFARRELLLGGFSQEFKLASDFNWLCQTVLDGRSFFYLNKIIANYNTTGESSDEKKLFWELYEIVKLRLGDVWAYIFLLLRKRRWLRN